MAAGRGSTAAGRDYSVQALAPRLFLTVFHLTAVGVAGGLLFGGGLENSTAVPLRRDLLFACAILYFLRVILTSFYLMKRRMGWGEATLIAVFGQCDSSALRLSRRNQLRAGGYSRRRGHDGVHCRIPP
jgi:hypothetical protein